LFICGWNASLAMIESILDMEVQINGVLLHSGNRDLTISPIDRAMLREQPFSHLTTMVSETLVHVGYVTLVRHQIVQQCHWTKRFLYAETAVKVCTTKPRQKNS
jgi:hypothetical protein